MRFPSMLRNLRNMQEGTESTPSTPYCPQPGEEPPWLIEARKYLFPSYLSSVRGICPTREGDKVEGQKKKVPHQDSLNRIKGWAATVEGVNVGDLDFEASSEGWCAAFAGAMLAKCGINHSHSNKAKSYYNPEKRSEAWGKCCGEVVGAIAVFERHVAFVVETLEMVKVHHPRHETGYVLGGNQSDSVNILKYSDFGPVLSYRWPCECPCPGEASESGEAN